MTKKLSSTVIALGLAMFAGSAAFAQAVDLDAVPEKMPFDVPYGKPITLERADAVLAAALGTSKAKGWKLICAVVDSGANLVAFQRMDNAQLASIDIAMHKARAAAKFRRPTVAFENGVQKSGLNYIMTLDDAIASRGGIPLVDSGEIIGAIGCSGGTGSQDEVIAKAGAALVK
jgi:glc operon protein GlcG